MRALLLVDIQNDFLPGGALAVKEGDAIISYLNEIQKEFDLILATKDWHPPHHISFASTHHKKPGEILELKDQKQELWPDHCIQGSFGAELSNKLNQEKISKVFFKGSDPQIDSYSAFFDNRHLRSTGLFEYLKEKKINELFIAGLATDFCVKYSVLDGIKLGFSMTVLMPGCKGIDLKKGDCERAIEEMKQAGAHFIL